MADLLWRYEIQHGPDGETEWSWVHDQTNRLICVAKTSDAVTMVNAVNARFVKALEAQEQKQ